MKKRLSVPDSGTHIFYNGCRVYILSSGVVGTVLKFENSEYLVMFMNRKGVIETKWFKPAALVEQPSLPFEDVPF